MFIKPAIIRIKNRKTMGAITKRPSILAYPFAMILCPKLITHKNKLMTSKNTTITIYAMSELRKLLISLLNNAIILIYGLGNKALK